jgi:hypothetical protein
VDIPLAQQLHLVKVLMRGGADGCRFEWTTRNKIADACKQPRVSGKFVPQTACIGRQWITQGHDSSPAVGHDSFGVQPPDLSATYECQSNSCDAAAARLIHALNPDMNNSE